MTRRTLLLLAVLLSSGCGTAANTLWLPDFEGGQRPYGGVRVDAEMIRSYATENGKSEGSVPTGWAKRLGMIGFFTLDLPLSIVGDTLTLFYTVPMEVNRSINQHYFPKQDLEKRTESLLEQSAKP